MLAGQVLTHGRMLFRPLDNHTRPSVKLLEKIFTVWRGEGGFSNRGSLVFEAGASDSERLVVCAFVRDNGSVKRALYETPLVALVLF